MEIAMIDNNIVPFDNLPPAHLDRGLYFGDGVYEVVRSYHGKIFALEEHLQRFNQSLQAVNIRGINISEIRTRVKKAFKAAKIHDAKIYFHITRGSAKREHLWNKNLKPNFLLTITELKQNPTTVQKGIAVSTHPDWRWKRCDIKSLNLLPNVLAARDAEKKDCSEAIFVNDRGFITEGASSAFFAVFQNTLTTAPLKENILPSITRIFVLRAARKANINVCEESITPQQAKNARELFTAVTTCGIIPVVKFDDKIIADGKPGKITKTIRREFQKFLP